MVTMRLFSGSNESEKRSILQTYSIFETATTAVGLKSYTARVQCNDLVTVVFVHKC